MIAVVVEKLPRREFISIKVLINSKNESRIELRILRLVLIRKNKISNPVVCHHFRGDGIQSHVISNVEKKGNFSTTPKER